MISPRDSNPRSVFERFIIKPDHQVVTQNVSYKNRGGSLSYPDGNLRTPLSQRLLKSAHSIICPPVCQYFGVLRSMLPNIGRLYLRAYKIPLGWPTNRLTVLKFQERAGNHTSLSSHRS